MADMATITAAITAFSSALTGVKNLDALVSKHHDQELNAAFTDVYTRLLSVQNELLTVRERTMAVDEENRQLKAALEEKGQYVGPDELGYFHQRDTPDRKLCPKCFQGRTRVLSLMTGPQEWSGGVRRQCKTCEHLMYDKPMETGAFRAGRHSRVPYNGY